MVGLEGNGLAEQMLREALQQEACDKAVQVTFVRENHFGLGERQHIGTG